MADTIHCPQCHAEIPLTDAVTHTLREQFTREFSEKEQTLLDKEKALNETIQSQRKAIESQEDVLKQRQLELDTEVRQKLEVERRTLTERATQQAREALNLQMQDLQAQLTDRAKQLSEAQKNELALRHQAVAVEERARNLELEISRKLDAERMKIREEAKRQAVEEQQLPIAEKEKLITDLKVQIETLKQKIEQGSQQLQGEVLELQLEEILSSAFPQDEIVPVPTGTRGADLLQHVHNGLGQKCGTIIWESKRTRNWSQPWLGKLKDDQRAQSADLAILVTQALPEGVTHSAPLEGVWVCGYTYALPLATALRSGLLQLAGAKRAESGKEEKMEVLYRFLTSAPFRQQVEGVVEAFVEMKRDLDNERRAMERLWKKREMQLTRVLNGTSSLYGSLQGIIGSAALPEIRALELGAEEEAP